MALRTDYKDAVLSESMTGRKRYEIIHNTDGTVTPIDKTEYDVKGDFLQASELNEANKSINELLERKTEDLTVTFEEAQISSELNSGDKLSVHFSKLSKIVKDSIKHIKDSLIHVPAFDSLSSDAVLRNDGKGLMWYKLPNVDVTFVYGKKINFPSTGNDKTVYVDQTKSQYTLYMWNGTEYCPVSGGVDTAIISKMNPVYSIEFNSSGFTLNKTTQRYESIVPATFAAPGLWVEWKMVRSSDVLSLEESRISGIITDLVCLDKKIKLVCTEAPNQNFGLQIKIIL